MLLRLSYLFLLITLAIAAFSYVYYVGRNERSALFVGAERCGVCHQPSYFGNQYSIWKNGPHGNAYVILEADSIKTYLSSHHDSIASCLPCHSTLGRAALNATEARLNREGVGCERCHGPGSKYSYFNVMTDRTLFTENAGVTGSLADCGQCHAASLAKSTRHCPFQFKDFNPDSAWPAIRHDIPERKAQPDSLQQHRSSS